MGLSWELSFRGTILWCILHRRWGHTSHLWEFRRQTEAGTSSYRQVTTEILESACAGEGCASKPPSEALDGGQCDFHRLCGNVQGLWLWVCCSPGPSRTWCNKADFRGLWAISQPCLSAWPAIRENSEGWLQHSLPSRQLRKPAPATFSLVLFMLKAVVSRHHPQHPHSQRGMNVRTLFLHAQLPCGIDPQMRDFSCFHREI